MVRMPTLPALNPRTPDFFGGVPAATETLNPVSLPKIPGAQGYIQELFPQATETRTRVQGDIQKYREMFGLGQPARTKALDQNTEFLNSVYSPSGVQAQLGSIRNRQAAAGQNLAQQMLGDLYRAMGLGSVGRGAQGLGSYLGRLAASEAGKIRTQEAAAAADRERADIGALLQMQMQGLGRVQALQDANLAGYLLPMQAEQTAQTGYANLLQQALQQALANQAFAYGINQYAHS